MSSTANVPPIQKPLRRWQFSLRGLLLVITVLCVVLATLGEDLWFLVYMGSASGALLSVLALQTYLLFNDALPSRRVLGYGAAVCMGISLFIFWLAAIDFLSIDRLLWPAFILSGPLFWATPWCLWRVLRRTPADFSFSQVRLGALIDLIIFAVAYALTHFLTQFQRGDSAAVIATLAGLTMSLPWIKLLRQHSMRDQPVWSWAENVSRGFLVSGLAVIGLWLAMLGSYVAFASSVQSTNLGFAIGLLFMFLLLILAGSCLFAIGCLTQLWRDRWHPWLTGVAGFVLVAFWIWLICVI